MAEPIILEPQKISWWLATLSKIVGAVLAAYLIFGWVAGNVFREKLDAFHTVAKPMIMKPIEENHKDIEATKIRVRALEIQNAELLATLKSIEKSQEKMDAKLDALLRTR